MVDERRLLSFGLGVASVSICAVLLLLLPSPGHDLLTVKARFRPQATSGQNVTTQSMFCGFWRVDGGFNATIHLKNSLIVGPIDVVPVLYMADGTEYALPLVHLQTAGVANVDVNAMLRSAPPSLSNHISQYGSAAIRYRYRTPGEVSASMELLNVPKSLIFVFHFAEVGGGMKPVAFTLDGLWWKHDPDVGGFIALTNTTENRLEARYGVFSSEGATPPVRGLTLEPHQVQLVELDRLLEDLPQREAKQGGIRVEYRGSPGDLLVSGGLENESEGYSAVMPFLLHEEEPVKVEKRTYGSTGLMVGKPDPMAGFPKITEFSPYTVLRNTTQRQMEVGMTVYPMGMGTETVNKIALPSEHLFPGQTKTIPLERLLPAVGLGSLNGSITLSLSFVGRPGDLLIATGSVDQTGTYVFEVMPEGATTSIGKEVDYWSVADGNDTMVSLWNPLDVQQELAVTFYYGDGTGQYTLAVTLPARGSMMLMMSMIISGAKADLNGNVFPPGIKRGSATITNSKDPYGPMTAVTSVGTFNVRTATCGGPCTKCAGVTQLAIDQGPGSMAVGTTMQLTATATYYSGAKKDVTGTAGWSSSNTSVATVQSVGSANPGMVSGVAPGSMTITADLSAVVGGVCPIPPTYDGGCQFNNFTSPVDCTVFCATPTNFSIQSESNLNDGSLFFTYTWSSSTGKQSDLAACKIGESVFYPNYPATPYVWPLPMVSSTNNPETNSGAGSNQVFTDQNFPPSSYQQSYFSASFPATQRFWWSCPCYQNGSLNYFGADVTITRKVFKDTDGFWKYQINKSGYTNTVRLPNQ